MCPKIFQKHLPGFWSSHATDVITVTDSYNFNRVLNFWSNCNSNVEKL